MEMRTVAVIKKTVVDHLKGSDMYNLKFYLEVWHVQVDEEKGVPAIVPSSVTFGARRVLWRMTTRGTDDQDAMMKALSKKRRNLREAIGLDVCFLFDEKGFWNQYKLGGGESICTHLSPAIF